MPFVKTQTAFSPPAFDFTDQGRLVRQVLPHPFVAVKQDGQRRPAGTEMFFSVRFQRGERLGLIGMVNAIPDQGPCLGNGVALAVQKGVGVAPKQRVIVPAAVHKILADVPDLGVGKSLGQFRPVTAGSVDVVGKAPPLQGIEEFVQKGRVEACSHPFHQNQATVLQRADPFGIPLRGLRDPTAFARMRHGARSTRQRPQSFLHHRQAADDIR